MSVYVHNAIFSVIHLLLVACGRCWREFWSHTQHHHQLNYALFLGPLSDSANATTIESNSFHEVPYQFLNTIKIRHVKKNCGAKIQNRW